MAAFRMDSDTALPPSGEKAQQCAALNEPLWGLESPFTDPACPKARTDTPFRPS